MADDHILFLDKVSFEKLKNFMAKCKALVFTGEEDFGIIPVEVMAAGRPVIAYGCGGVLDTIKDGVTGLLYQKQSVDGLISAVERFEASSLANCDPAILKQHVRKFDESHFINGILRVLKRYNIDLRSHSKI